MRLPRAAEAAILILAVFFSFYWHNQSSLSKFNWQLVSLLILIFLFHNWKAKKRQNSDPVQIYQNITNISIVVILTAMLVLTTGGAASPLFWLLNFLLFFAAVFSRAGSGISLSLALVLAFLLNEPQLTTGQLFNLVSLLSMAPLAAFFSSQYRRVITDQIQIKELSDQADLMERSTLLWLALDFRRQMETAIDLLSEISATLTAIPVHQKDRLNRLYRDLKSLWQSGQELEKKIDEATEE